MYLSVQCSVTLSVLHSQWRVYPGAPQCTSITVSGRTLLTTAPYLLRAMSRDRGLVVHGLAIHQCLIYLPISQCI